MTAATALQPSYEIKVDGTALRKYDDIVSVEIRKGLDVASSAHIEIRTDDLDSCAFAVGKKVKIELAPDGSSSLTVVFEGTVLGLGCEVGMGAGGRPRFVVDAYDDSYQLGRSTVVKTHVDTTLKSVVESIAGDASLSPDIKGLPTTNFESLQQYGTPHQFLDSLVRPAGCYWYVEGAKLIVRPRTEAPSGVTLTAGSDLISFRARVAASEQIGEVNVRGWDPGTQKAVVGTSSSSTELSGAATAVGQKVTSTHKATAWSRTPVDATDAKSMATALQQWMDDSRVTGRGETWCAPSIVPGSSITIDGMGALFNGSYHVSHVEHRLQAGQAFVTRFTVGASEPAALVDLMGAGAGGSSSASFLGGVTVGVVTNLDDPMKLNRVKLKLPYLTEDEEIGWARVMQFGAGNGRGWWMQPDVGDEVIVAFENGDPRLPIVIGGVWSKKITAPGTAALKSGKLENRSYTSAKGHLLNFDDGSKPAIELAHASTKARLRMDDNDGILIEAPDQKLVIKNKKGSITITVDGDILLEGANIQLKSTQDIKVDGGGTVNVKSKSNTTIDATAKLDLKSKAPATLESAAITTVKGSMVKIN